MNNRSKRTMKDLEALGCYRDHDAISGAPVNYRHPNDPEQLFKVSDAMTDSARTFVVKRAMKVAELSTSGGTDTPTLKERAEIKRRERKLHDRREIEARRERAAAAEARYDERAAERAARDACRAAVDAAESDLVDVDEAVANMRQTIARHGRWTKEFVDLSKRLDGLLRQRDDLLGIIEINRSAS